MSREQIVATFAEVAVNLRFEEQADDCVRLTGAQRNLVSSAVSVVPDTSLIPVRVAEGTVAIAERVADATTSVAATYLSDLSKPCWAEIVHPANGTATSSGPSAALLLAAFVVALTAGLAVQQAVYHLLSATRSQPKPDAMLEMFRSGAQSNALVEHPVGAR